MNIKVCMKCLGNKVRKHHHGDLYVEYFPLVVDWVCEDCGYKGIPIIFCSEEDYERFSSVKESYRISKDKGGNSPT